MHKCLGGWGVEGGDFMAYVYVADLLQGFWGSNVFFFFIIIICPLFLFFFFQGGGGRERGGGVERGIHVEPPPPPPPLTPHPSRLLASFPWFRLTQRYIAMLCIPKTNERLTLQHCGILACHPQGFFFFSLSCSGYLGWVGGGGGEVVGLGLLFFFFFFCLFFHFEILSKNVCTEI